MKKTISTEHPTKQDEILQKLISLPYPTAYCPPYTEIPFGDLFEVWAKVAMSELKSQAGSSFEILTCEAEKNLLDKLVIDFSSRCAPTFAALLHIAKFEKKLKGESPKDRYFYFLKTIISDPQYLTKVFEYFPRLGGIVASTYTLWIEQAIEFLSRLHRDIKQIEEAFSFNNPLGKAVSFSLSLSDPHNGNRSVYRIEFENGIRLIYKPRSLSLDVVYNRFLEKLDIPNGLKSYQVLDRGDYGWIEFIETLPCEEEEGLKRYFERVGMILCLAFILEGTDFHYENLIASGEDPFLIDLESLFHPMMKQVSSRPDLAGWNHSVFRTGFLPGAGMIGRKKMDASPLSAEEELTGSIGCWQDVNTDQMQVVVKKKKIQISVPRPKYKGITTPVAPYIPDLLIGFEKMYRYFMEHQKEILAWVEDFWPHPVRYIFRSTELYSQILQRLSDPKLTHSEAETEKTLEVLTRFSSLKASPCLKKITALEIEALLQGDIPFFQSSPQDTHLYAGKKRVLRDFFQRSAKAYCIEKIQQLNESDLKLQMQYIDYSLYFLKKSQGVEPCEVYTEYDLHQEEAIRTDSELLRFAEQIGEKILALSQPLSDGNLSWIGLELDPTQNRTTFQPITSHLYSGLCGIAFFLAHLGKISQRPDFMYIARQLLDRAIKPYYEDKESMKLLTTIGAFTGVGGLIYCLTSLGMDEEALHLATFIEKKKIEEDTAFDIISGSAGLICVLLVLFDHTNDPSVLELAKTAGLHLLKKAKPAPVGIAWGTLDSKCLCGFSHGTAGIAYALLKLYERTKDRVFLEGAKLGFDFERDQYSPEEKTWPDLRKENNFLAHSWCHGAPGIALSRLYASKLLPRGEELENALRATASHLQGTIDHLCCGTFGRISILWDAAKKLQSKHWKELAQKQTALLLRRFEKTGVFRFFSDLPDKVQSPGFMQGLAGIGYLLLRMTEVGEHLPEVLILE